MAYFTLFYDTVDDFVARRQPYRAGHLEMIDDALRAGRLVLAGALKPSGALLVFNVPRAAEVEAFANNDPYVLNGLVKGWRVNEWAVVVGEHAVPR